MKKSLYKLWNAICSIFGGRRKMDKENLTPITTVNGIEINEELLQKIIPASRREEIVDVTISSYLFRQLGIDDNELSEEKRELIQKNFIHLMCQVINDLNITDKRLKNYKAERERLNGVKSNEAEYKRRKLDYFSKLNNRAQNEIATFLSKDIAKYLIETDYDTLQREVNRDGLGMLFGNRRYLFAQVSEYYDADFDYSTVVKVSQLPDIELVDRPKTEKKYLEMHRNNPEKYYVEIKKIIEQKKVMENIKKFVEQNYHLYKRREIFTDLAHLYEEKHYQSFIALGLLQLEGLFFDICSIRYEDKENAGTLVEKAEKALSGKNEISYMRYYPYFAFDVPIKRNEIAHTGLVKSPNLEQLADELILDLNAIVRMAQMESDGKFRIFLMINDALAEMDFSDEKAINQKLIEELFDNRIISTDSFWEVLKNPNQFDEEIEFYKQDDLSEGYVDLPTVVKNISNMVYQLPFWCEMVNILNEINSSDRGNDDITQFLLNMAKNYVSVLDKDPKNKCIEILKTLK